MRSYIRYNLVTDNLAYIICRSNVNILFNRPMYELKRLATSISPDYMTLTTRNGYTHYNVFKPKIAIIIGTCEIVYNTDHSITIIYGDYNDSYHFNENIKIVHIVEELSQLSNIDTSLPSINIIEVIQP